MTTDNGDKLTIGQKLLKEPIWIGMIVILNLLLLFCITYVIRRKCGTAIMKMLPKRRRRKSLQRITDDGRKIEASPGCSRSIDGRSLYSIHLDTPSTSAGACWSPSVTISRINREKDIEIHSPPLTPVINEDNKEAAMKMFRAYNAKKEHISPVITSIQQGDDDNIPTKIRDITAFGIQAGSMTLNSEYLSDMDGGNTHKQHGMIRSYTLNSGTYGLESRRSKFQKDERKVSSYGGSPQATPILDLKHISTYPAAASKQEEFRHCYPVIKIINEHNIEENITSDSEASVLNSYRVINEFQTNKTSDIPVPKGEHVDETVEDIKIVDIADSGYPSTTTMSNTTQSSSQADELQRFVAKPTAAQRRSLFTSKAKSASFYNIETMDNIVHFDDEVISEPVNKHKQIGSFGSSATNCGSFDSEKCRSCEKENRRRLVASYESSLNNLYKNRQCSFDSSVHSRRCRRPRHHHRHRCGCSSRSHRHRPTDLAPHLAKRQSIVPLPSSCSHHGANEHKVKRRHYTPEIVTTCSSTDSDPCACSVGRSSRHRRREQYRRHKGVLSEHDYNRMAGLHSYHEHKHTSYKTKQMHSFLKDAYTAKVHGYHDAMYHIHDELTEKPCRSYRADKPSPTRSVDRTAASSLKHSEHKTHRRRYSNSVSFDIPSRYDPSPRHFVFPDSKVAPYLDDENTAKIGAHTDPKTYKRQQKDARLPMGSMDIDVISSNSDRNISNTDESVFSTERKMEIEDGEIRTIRSQGKVTPKPNEKDSAYQTKQSSLDQRFREDRLWSNSSSVKHRPEPLILKPDDRVNRHLHQAAMKLSLMKRLKDKSTISKDSAVHTFSEDDLSADDTDSRLPSRPSSAKRRTSLGLAFQLKEMSLSQVTEELSCISRDTETPNNEPTNADPGQVVDHVAGNGSDNFAREWRGSRTDTVRNDTVRNDCVQLTELSELSKVQVFKDIIGSLEETQV